MVAEFDDLAVGFGELVEGRTQAGEVLGAVIIYRSGFRRGVEVILGGKLVAQDALRSLALADQVADAVHRDSEEPGFESTFLLVFARAEFGADSGEHALGDLLSDMVVAAATVGHRKDSRAVQPDQLAPGGLIARRRSDQKRGDAGFLDAFRRGRIRIAGAHALGASRYEANRTPTKEFRFDCGVIGKSESPQRTRRARRKQKEGPQILAGRHGSRQSPACISEFIREIPRPIFFPSALSATSAVQFKVVRSIMPPAASFHYAVTATLPSLSVRDEYVAWLTGGTAGHGHIADVIAAGATSGEVILLDGEGSPRVQARYTFANRAAFVAYVRDHAPRLRAEGLARFGSSGITFDRTAGEAVYAGPSTRSS